MTEATRLFHADEKAVVSEIVHLSNPHGEFEPQRELKSSGILLDPSPYSEIIQGIQAVPCDKLYLACRPVASEEAVSPQMELFFSCLGEVCRVAVMLVSNYEIGDFGHVPRFYMQIKLEGIDGEQENLLAELHGEQVGGGLNWTLSLSQFNGVTYQEGILISNLTRLLNSGIPQEGLRLYPMLG